MSFLKVLHVHYKLINIKRLYHAAGNLSFLPDWTISFRQTVQTQIRLECPRGRMALCKERKRKTDPTNNANPDQTSYRAGPSLFSIVSAYILSHIST